VIVERQSSHRRSNLTENSQYVNHKSFTRGDQAPREGEGGVQEEEELELQGLYLFEEIVAHAAEQSAFPAGVREVQVDGVVLGVESFQNATAGCICCCCILLLSCCNML